MSWSSQEAPSNLGLKHALEDLLSAFESRGSISEDRLQTVIGGILGYLKEALDGKRVAEGRTFLLKHEDKRSLQEFNRLKGILGDENIVEAVEKISKTLQGFSEKAMVNDGDRDYALERLKKFLLTVRLMSTPVFPDVPPKILSL